MNMVFLILFSAICSVFWIPSGGRLPYAEARDIKTWCDDVLGCLNITEEWYSVNRLINVLPQTRNHINTRFILQTRSNPNDYFISADDPTTIQLSTFDASKLTKFIIHGFLDNGFKKWMREMAAALLGWGDYNVIRVDWGGGSSPMYSQATGNTRVVGLEIGHLVNHLMTAYHLDSANVHCIGHSLGAHISGYAGEQIPGMGRISGMDPAGPYFTGTDVFVRLDPTDAIFVDAIHTDANAPFMMGYGTFQPMGHVDFYPNSGRDQPGCEPVSVSIDVITADDIDEAVRTLFACSHQRAVALYTESLTIQECKFLAHECVDYLSFESGHCGFCGADNHLCAYMGIRAEEYLAKSRINVPLYLDTDEDSTFCYFHYQVIVNLAHPNEARNWVMGKIRLWLHGENGASVDDIQITGNHERLDHGQSKSFMFKSHIDLGDVFSVEMFWEYKENILDVGSYCAPLLCNRALYVKSVLVSPMNYYPEKLAYTHLTCEPNGSTIRIKSGQKETFVSNDFCTDDVTKK